MNKSSDVHFKITDEIKKEIDFICEYNSISVTNYFTILHKRWYRDNKKNILNFMGDKE